MQHWIFAAMTTLMVTQNTLKTCEGLLTNKCLKQIKIQISLHPAPIFCDLPSNMNSMGYMNNNKNGHYLPGASWESQSLTPESRLSEETETRAVACCFSSSACKDNKIQMPFVTYPIIHISLGIINYTINNTYISRTEISFLLGSILLALYNVNLAYFIGNRFLQVKVAKRHIFGYKWFLKLINYQLFSL